MIRLVVALVVLAGLLAMGEPSWALGQTGPAGAGELARQSLRPYAHVFIAYALAWLVVLGWVVSIGRRLGRVEEEVGEGSEG